ncbi:hypothetical protein THAOC_21620 [Thalassiosira oceanica]|uniref:EF-hand domain-containing protein n=1 Tax=Thalassiosira oceanica TaxID=159749 RepID=K0RWY5_THAOC|nr:hypothetical protein THAOC_21620 [Thalassiosira oceanica]|mmetsp:Transcript_23648/g.55957  ORF Transcript_23648/g.55957 Transcript_23648/m.55957 type:complete len:251 (-) Transcript_23648:113-865(-)|eukprot:EJK58273.1 hypothetical protein THAOC_21620 [Thalassiosira oceanica]
MTMSEAGATTDGIAISSFPAELHPTLTEAFDADGDGFIDSSELLAAAQLHKQTKSANSLLRKGLLATGVATAALIAVMGGLTYGIVDANKDTVTEGRALMTKGTHEPVSVGTNEIGLSLGNLPFVPSEVLSKINDVSFMAEDNGIEYFRKVDSIDVTSEDGFVLETTKGDKITWNVVDGTELTISLVDGTSWNKHIACSACTAINVFASAAVLEGIAKFEEAVDLAGGRKLRYGYGYDYDYIYLYGSGWC